MKTGRRLIDDGHNGRVYEIAAAIEFIVAAGLDPNVVLAMRGGELDDNEAYAVVVSGMTSREAHRYWMNPDDLPPVDSLMTLAALRGINTLRLSDS